VKGIAVMYPEVIGSDPEMTSFDWKWPGKGCRRPKTCVLGAFMSSDVTSTLMTSVLDLITSLWSHVRSSLRVKAL